MWPHPLNSPTVGGGGFWDSKTLSEILVAIDFGIENPISIGQK